MTAEVECPPQKQSKQKESSTSEIKINGPLVSDAGTPQQVEDQIESALEQIDKVNESSQ